jgi:hypothetical protein
MAERPPCLTVEHNNALGIVVGASFVGVIGIPAFASLIGGMLEGSAAATAAASGGAAFLGGMIMYVILAPSFTCAPADYDGCIAGVVNSIDLGIEDGGGVFPWMERHPCVQLVPKSSYWEFMMKAETMEDDPPQGVFCMPTGRVSTPFMMCYYRSEKLCNASEGAALGGVGGGIGGMLTSMVVVAAIGCAALITCLLALLLAALIGAAAVVVGMVIGGQAGAASGTSTTVEDSEDGVNLHVGDYVTLKGKFGYDSQTTARIGWFITETAIHGRSTGAPPFTNADPDANLTNDDCPVPPVVN